MPTETRQVAGSDGCNSPSGRGVGYRREQNPYSLKEGHWSTASMPKSGRFPRVQASTTPDLELRSLWGVEDGDDGFRFVGRTAGRDRGSTDRACVNNPSKSSNLFRMAKVAGSKLLSLNLASAL